MDINCLLAANCLIIFDGYKTTSSKKMKNFLELMKHKHPDHAVLSTRSVKGMVSEWKTHNLLYELHLFREHTRDVDLNLVPKFIQFLYNVIGFFYISH